MRDAVAARAAKPTPYQYSDLETLSWGRLVLGSKWAPDGQPAQIVSDLAFSRLTNAWRNLTVGAQARVGLVLAAEKGDSGERRPAMCWRGIKREGEEERQKE